MLRIQTDSVAAAGFIAAWTDIADRVDFKTRRIVARIILNPPVWKWRPFGLRKPGELDAKFIVFDGNVRHFATVEITFAGVLDFD